MRAIDSLAPAGSPAAGRATPTGAARPMATALEVELGHATRPGPRPANEDFVAAAMPEGAERAAKGVLLAIADGVGGHAHGREAAEYTVRSLLADYFSTAHTWSVQKSLDTVLGAANRWLLAQSARSAETAGMATTLTALVLRGRRWHLAHVGDSRAYLWRDGALVRLSEDHTWPHPELNNVLRRAVGLESRLLVDHDDGELAAGDVFVLLTDGVWNALGEVEIAAVLARHVGEEKERGGRERWRRKAAWGCPGRAERRRGKRKRTWTRRPPPTPSSTPPCAPAATTTPARWSPASGRSPPTTCTTASPPAAACRCRRAWPRATRSTACAWRPCCTCLA